MAEGGVLAKAKPVEVEPPSYEEIEVLVDEVRQF